MESSPAVALAFSHRLRIGEDGRTLPGGDAPTLTQTGLVDGTALGDAVLEFNRNIIGELTTCLFRRSDVDPATLWQVDGKELAANGDVALWLDLLAGRKAFHTERPLSSFRMHGGQRSGGARLIAEGVRRTGPG